MSQKNYIPISKKSHACIGSIGLALFQFALLTYASVNVFFLAPGGRSNVSINQADLIQGVSVLGYRIFFWGSLALMATGFAMLIFSIDQPPRRFYLAILLLIIGTFLAATVGNFGVSVVAQFALVVVAQGLIVVTGWIASTVTESPTRVTADNSPDDAPGQHVHSKNKE